MRVRVVLGASTVPAWQASCVHALQALEGVELDLAFVENAAAFPRGLAGRLAGPAFARYGTVSLGRERPNSGASCDVVIDLTGRAAPAFAKHGVWTVRIGEDGDARQPFVREIGRGEQTVDVDLVRRVDGRDELIRRGRFSVARLYASTLRWAVCEAAQWPAIYVAALRDGVALETKPLPVARARRPLALVDHARFALRLPALLGGFVVEQLFETTQWNVGLVGALPRRLLEPGPLDIRWLPEPPAGTFIADPFVIERDDRRVVFVEQYSSERDRGVIEALELNARDEVIRRETIIDLPTHLSYPYPLEIDGVLHLLPENSAGNDVAMFRCVEFPWRWERGPMLFPEFDAIDTTLFEHAGCWWAFCTRASRGSTLALHAYHAQALRGPWYEHALNPIVVDVTCARPAGQPFVIDGVLYRPGQSSAGSYGSGMAIARIDELTPQTYRETVVRRIDLSGHGRYGDGTHTLSFANGTIAIDGKRVYHDVRKLGWVVSSASRRLRRLTGTRAKPSLA